MRYNFHTHSCLDDGKDQLENYVINSITQRLSALGFSAHAPINVYNEWCLPEEKLQYYCNQVKMLKEKYAGKIDIYLGLEMDYIPGISKGFDSVIKKQGLEYTIGSIHLVKNPESNNLWFIDGPIEGYKKGLKSIFNNNAKNAVEAFYQQSIDMVVKEKPNIIGHLDKVKMHNNEQYFSEQEDWYKNAVGRLLKAIAKNNTIVEINTRGKYNGRTDSFFPSTNIIEKCYTYKIPVMVNTDAHDPSEVNKLFDEAIKLLKDIGYRETQTPFFKAKMS